MSKKDIFDEPFDEGTLTKLEIFEKYFEAWLPTFIMSSYSKRIRVFDLFAGEGYDTIGQEGSPIRILKIINKFRDILMKQNKKIHLYLNDMDSYKYSVLVNNIEVKLNELSLNSLIELYFSQCSFERCLVRYKKEFLSGCNLLFIDQNGFKEVNESIFQYLIQLETTEFVFFISSSHIHRFAESPEVQKVHPKFDFNRIRNTSRKKIHNVICEEYEKYVPKAISSYGLIPFSIIKNDNNNVYGLIFVCKHILGADKFLDVVWRKNPINGNANFDIDDDLGKDQLDLFEEKKLTKIEAFQKHFREKILKSEITTNVEAYIFTLNKGHIHQHADPVMQDMKRNKIINYEGRSPLINYEQAIKNRRIVNFRVTNEYH